MSSRKNGADAHTKKAAKLFVVCEGNPNPTRRLSIPNVTRLRGYSQDEAVNRTLQMQVRQEVKILRQCFHLSFGCTLCSQCDGRIVLYNCHEACIDLARGK